MKEMSTEKLFWVDAVKAICMIGVYLLHSEAHYGTGGISYGYWIEPFYVNAFFFVSGYLFFRKYLKDDLLINFKWGGYCRGMQNVLFRLIIPTLLFSTLVYLPKLFFHGKAIAWSSYFFDVFGGLSYWFTSALVVAQVILLTLLLLRRIHIGFYVFVTFLLAALGMYLNLERTSNAPEAFFPWFYKTGLEYTFVMALGGVYYCFENKLDKVLKYVWWVLLAVYICVIALTWEVQSVRVMGFGGVCNLSGVIVMICGVGLIVWLCKQLRSVRWLEFIGRNSIVFYFFSGVMPAVCGTIAKQVVAEKSYVITILVAVVSVLLSYCVTWVIVRYLPFFSVLRKLRHS